MKIIRQIATFLLLLSIPCLAVQGFCAEAAKIADEQKLVIAFDAADATTLDPHRATTIVDRSTADMIFNGLVRYPPGNQVAVKPDLAEKWEKKSGGKRWIFHLRKGVKFHPYPGSKGDELTSEDVVYSLKRAANPKLSAYADEYAGINVTAINRYTVQITIKKPVSDPLFLAKFANYAGGFIVCKKAIKKKGEKWFVVHPVGTGPFIFDTYKPNQRTALKANPGYFRGKPVLSNVKIRYMPNITSREFGLRTGEIQIIEGLNEAGWAEKINTLPDVTVTPFGPCEAHILHFNLANDLFRDINLRKAVSYAIDRSKVAAFMGKRLAEPIYAAALAPPASGSLTERQAKSARAVFDANPEKAKSFLKKAGYENGLELEVLISEPDASSRKPVSAIQALLKKVGINMKLKAVDHSAFRSLIRKDASPMVYSACWLPNADRFLTRFFHSAAVVTSDATPDMNFSHYGVVDADGDGKVDTIDALIEKARAELNVRQQIKLWKDAQVQLLKDVAVVPIICLKYLFPMKSYVDLGHPLTFSWQTCSPQITEKTRILAH